MSSSTKLSLIIDDARQENFQFAFYDPTLGGVPYFYQSTAHTSPVPPTADESKFVDIIFEGTSITIFGNTSSPQVDPTQNFTVSIDGGQPFAATYGDPNPPSYRQWFQSPLLTQGEHNISLFFVLGASIDFGVVDTISSLEFAADTAETLIVDDSDSAIAYPGSGWTQSGATFNIFPGQSAFVPYANGTHQTAHVGDGFSFSFSGGGTFPLGVYGIMDWTKLGLLNITFSVDGGPATFMSFNIDDTAAGFVQGLTEPNFLFYNTPSELSSGEHTLLATVTACENQAFILDYITYTPNFTDTPAISPSIGGDEPSSTSSPVSAGFDGISAKKHVGPIVGGVVGGLALLTVVVLLLGWVARRKPRRVAGKISMYPFRHGALWNTNTNTIPLAVMDGQVVGQDKEYVKLG